jgi:hypothetical protein
VGYDGVMHGRYDFIGDIHGQMGALVALLGRLGYARTGEGWRHPERTAVFLGDFIDRGPRQVEVVQTVRAMVETGAALAVMGNHEFNALCWVREDPYRPGAFLRPHDAGKAADHRAFLDQVGDGSALHQELLAWFQTLPLWLDLPEARVIHACWDPARIARVGTRLVGGCADDDFLVEAGSKGASLFHDVEVLLKGLEVRLPEGVRFPDKNQRLRDAVRVRWWLPHGDTLRECALLDFERLGIDGEHRISFERPVAPDARPCFVGHYWFRSSDCLGARVCTPLLACVDFSAGVGKHLAAYRFDGEAELRDERFVLVDVNA